MKKKFQIGAVALLAASVSCLSLSLSSCADNDNITRTPGIYHYEQFVPNKDVTIRLVLDSLLSPIKSIESCPDWATVTGIDSMSDGHPYVSINARQSNNETPNTADVTMYSEINDKVTLSLKQYFRMLDNNNAANEAFVTD